jgi:hypothetical protein
MENGKRKKNEWIEKHGDIVSYSSLIIIFGEEWHNGKLTKEHAGKTASW